jgi:hypothetical protein
MTDLAAVVVHTAPVSTGVVIAVLIAFILGMFIGRRK